MSSANEPTSYPYRRRMSRLEGKCPTPSASSRAFRVSAIVSVYKSERFMRGLLEDLEAQTIADQMEIVLCDANSPQNEAAIVREFQAKYDNIVYFRTPDREPISISFNRCIHVARGQYITMANTDDRHRPDAFEIMARALDARPDVALVFADSLITRAENETFARNAADRVFRWPDYSVRQSLMYCQFGPQAMWRANLGDDVDWFDEDCYFSNDLQRYVDLAHKHGAYHIPDVLGLYMEGGFEAQHQPDTQQEALQVLHHYRTTIPLEDIYPDLRAFPDDPSARASALLDFANNILQGIYPDFPLARDFYQQARALVGDHPAILNNLAVAHLLLGETDQAVALLEALARHDDSVGKHNLRLFRSGAQAGYVLAVISHPVLANLPALKPPSQTQEPWNPREQALRHNAEGEALFEQGKIEAAGDAFQRAAQYDPTLAVSHNNLGVWYWTKDDAPNALASFRRALELDPNDQDARENYEKLMPSPQPLSHAVGEGLSKMDSSPLSRSVGEGGRGGEGISFVIISGGHRAEMIQVVMQSIRAQNIPHYEIMVTGKYEEREGIRYLPAEDAARGHKLGEMRNLGMNSAHYDKVMFLDDDCLLAPGWYQAFLNGPQDFDILTMRVLLPDGTRYWDHACLRENGQHFLLRDDETDPDVYATGGILLVRARVGQAVAWDESLLLAEDVDYSRRCQVRGFSIVHNKNSIVYHADPTYTSTGRWVHRRKEGRCYAWAEAELHDKSAQEIFLLADAHLRQTRLAEAMDCLRYGILRYPQDTRFATGLTEFESMSGGHLPGIQWYPDGDPAYLNMMRSYREAVFGPQPEVDAPAPARCVQLAPDIAPPIMDEITHFFQSASCYGPRFDTRENAEDTRLLLHALEAAGYNLAAQPFAAREEFADRLRNMPLLEGTFWKTLAQRPPEPNSAHIRAIPPPYLARSQTTGRQVLRLAFPTDRLPASWVAACNRAEQVWVPSAFHLETFARAGVEQSQLVIVPGVLAPDYFSLDTPPMNFDGARGFSFLCLLDWTQRSGWDVLVQAFTREFTRQDDVSLILAPWPWPGFHLQEIVKRVMDCLHQVRDGDLTSSPHVLLQTSEISPSQRPNFYRAGDCFVLPARGEAWGRYYLEAMAMGLPTIATGWGAHTEFMSADNSYLIDYTLTDVPPSAWEESPLFEGHRWAEPNEAHLRQQMRQVFTHRTEAKQIGQQARQDILAHYSYIRLAERLPDLWAASVFVEAIL